jgi:hypothetical protein
LAIQRENLQTSMEIVTSTYSSDLRNLIMYLLTNPTRIKSVNDLMPMIGELQIDVLPFPPVALEGQAVLGRFINKMPALGQVGALRSAKACFAQRMAGLRYWWRVSSVCQLYHI